MHRPILAGRVTKDERTKDMADEGHDALDELREPPFGDPRLDDRELADREEMVHDRLADVTEEELEAELRQRIITRRRDGVAAVHNGLLKAITAIDELDETQRRPLLETMSGTTANGTVPAVTPRAVRELIAGFADAAGAVDTVAPS